MGNLFKYIILIFLGLSLCGLVGCGGKKKTSGRISSGHGDRDQANRGNTTFERPDEFDDSYYPGRIVGSPQEDFQQGVDSLISSFMDPLDPNTGIGTVSGTQGDDTGVWFNGLLRIRGGFDSGESYNTSIQSGSFINVLIWDEYAGLEEGDGFIPGINIGSSRIVSGSINGRDVDLKFEYQDKSGNTLGYLELVGTYDSSEFSGGFFFENEKFNDSKYDGNGCGNKGACGRLGGFFIPTCEIFECSN